MRARACGCSVLAAALALACAAPPGAAHAEQLVRTYAQGEAVQGELVLDGLAYKLVRWEPGDGLEAATRTFERTTYKTVAAADYGGDPKAAVEPETSIDEEGFIGRIPLADAKAEVSASHPERSDYEETVDFSFVTRAEIDALPQKRTAVVSGRETKLEKLDVKYDREPSDPGTEIYSGHAVYGIHEQHDVPDEYRLTATYAGTLSREAAPATVVATYEPQPAEENIAQAEQPEQAQKPEPRAPTYLWTVCIPAAALVAFTLIVMCTMVRRRAGGENPEGEDGKEAEPDDAGRPDEEEDDADLED